MDYMKEPKNLKRGNSGWYLWHYYKNEQTVLILAILTPLMLIITGGVVGAITAWIWCIGHCYYKNNELGNDAYIRKRREAYWKYCVN